VSDPASRAGGSCLILGYDRTVSARSAATWAARQLQPEGKLVIVHACRPLHAQPSPLSSFKERHELGRALIDELMMDTDALIDVDIEAEISDHDPVTALIDAARRHDAQGIVVGHERHSTLHRALGTVTSELLNTSPVPVVAVPLTAAEISEQTLTPQTTSG
jgi:nucleotide-binding universal stress UspA family protein